MGDREERFRRIYNDHYESILGYALRRTDRSDDAVDVAADTFTIAWRRLGDVPEGERARLWLYGTARKVLANHHRGQRRQRRLAERLRTHVPRVTPSVGASAWDGPDLQMISTAFSRLSPDDRDLLLLVGWEGLNAGQIAEVLGCKRGTARVRLHRARMRFARALKEAGVQRSAGAGHEASRWATARPGTEEMR